MKGKRALSRRTGGTVGSSAGSTAPCGEPTTTFFENTSAFRYDLFFWSRTSECHIRVELRDYNLLLLRFNMDYIKLQETQVDI